MVKIITDSAADLPAEIIEEYQIEVIPLQATSEKGVFLDGVTITPEKLFNDMREGEVYKTSQVTVNEFQERFTRVAENGTSCLYLAFSSELSGTYQSAVLARTQVKEEYPDFDLEILDTKCASLGQGLVVYQTARLAKEGLEKAELMDKAAFYARHMEHIFTVDDLDYLQRGGRVSKATAFMGGLLNIKPILDVEDGKLVPLEKKKGRKKVFRRIVEIMEERGEDISRQTIGISHGDDLEGAETLKAMIEKKFTPREIVINTIGAVIGAHAGPGTMALFFLNELPE